MPTGNIPTKEQIIAGAQNASEVLLVRLVVEQHRVTKREICEALNGNREKLRRFEDKYTQFDNHEWNSAREVDTTEVYMKYLRDYEDGCHRDEARKAIKTIEAREAADAVEREWQDLDKTDKSALRSYIANHPDSPHIVEAQSFLDNLSQNSRRRYSSPSFKRMLNDIEGEYDNETIVSIVQDYIDEEKITLDQLYDEIRRDKNIFSAETIDGLEENDILDFSELEDRSEIDRKFIEFITNEDLYAEFDPNNPPLETISPYTTEVYFWGIPRSGKTCAIGAIIGEILHGKIVDFAEPNTHCQGYDCMSQLGQYFNFSNEVFKLPPSTQTSAIFEMGYTLKKNKRNYPVTFIDLSGEVIESMYLSNAKKPMSEDKLRTLAKATRLLKGNHKVNRKIHFFVLEFNGHNKLFKGLTQKTLLTGALSYIKDTGIFKTETDAIYLLITKSDLAEAYDYDSRNEILANYIRDNYGQFYNGLKNICEDPEIEINDGIVDIIPFSLGEICFQNLCRFNHAYASTVVEIILDRAKGFKNNKFTRALNIFKK